MGESNQGFSVFLSFPSKQSNIEHLSMKFNRRNFSQQCSDSTQHFIDIFRKGKGKLTNQKSLNKHFTKSTIKKNFRFSIFFTQTKFLLERFRKFDEFFYGSFKTEFHHAFFIHSAEYNVYANIWMEKKFRIFILFLGSSRILR